ncbi:coiled-coil domain-containing protein 30 isoform X2 [Podarcis raffonei]|uniref:coiled-coil domain-containing protein 30 isoform X2 n=1 Tax=Podarcis raffonei TaxID=65483 RepID=UPI0023298828|nr:coiled-coil domain-containing protein 30 isoform X2 [Podarcis raffonei]
MEGAQPEQAHIEDITQQLKEEGVDTTAPAKDQLCYVWSLFLRSQEELHSAAGQLEKLRRQQVEEMREVENYVAHIRMLTEARDSLATAFERENAQLRVEVTQLQLAQGGSGMSEYNKAAAELPSALWAGMEAAPSLAMDLGESQQKEVEEMLEQEGLFDIAHSSPSEQVAYLLVERSTLLEKIDALEQKLQSPSCLESLCAAQLQSHAEELARQSALLRHTEQHLEEATHRLQLAQAEIRRLTEELATQKENQSKLAPSMAESLKEEANKVEDSEMSELQKARELNIRLDQEILALRSRVQLLDSERQMFLEQAEKLDEEVPKYQVTEEEPRYVLARTDQTKEQEGCLLQDKKGNLKAEEETSILDEAASESEHNKALHQRCRQAIEGVECQNSQLLHKLQKLEREHEDLVERNEELESLLGETQNQTKDEREQFECEIDGLQRKISRLEAELWKAQKSKSNMADEETSKVADSQEARNKAEKSKREKVEELESKLLEETEWRKQLACNLEMTQKALKDGKKELHSSKSELLRLRGAAEERDFMHVTLEKLQQENVMLEMKVSELFQECEQLNHILTEGKKPGEISLASRRMCPELTAKERALEDQIHSQGEEREQLRVRLLESKKKTEELEKKVKESYEERRRLWEENMQLRKDMLDLQCQLNTKSTANVRAKREAGFGENPPRKTQAPMGSTDGEPKQGLLGERPEQKEDGHLLWQDVQRIQNLGSSTEKELRYEREKNLKCNILLQQENIKVKAELRQMQLKLSDSAKACSSLTSQWELSQQKVKELELELLRQTQAAKQLSSLREKIAQEKARATEAERKILELQQTLKESHHQVRLSETHVLVRKQLEEQLKEAREEETKAQRQFQEEQRKRKLLDQQTEDLQQQLRHSQENEAQLARTFAELQIQHQHQEAQLRILEEEKKTLSNEHLQCQKYSQKISGQLLGLQQERETLREEYEHILKEVAISVRKQKERQLRHKAKLRRAKETFICEVKQRDVRIRHLENELKLSKSQSEKDAMLIAQVTTENDSLLQEKRKLTQQLHKLEEAERSSKQELSTIQSRVRLLDEENKQLQEWTLQLTGQVGLLERALRSIHSHSLEELKSIGFSEFQPQSKVLPLRSVSFSVMELSDSHGLLKAVQDGKPEDHTERSLLASLPCPPSEIGYLNVASPGETSDLRTEEQSQALCCDHV